MENSKNQRGIVAALLIAVAASAVLLFQPYASKSGLQTNSGVSTESDSSEARLLSSPPTRNHRCKANQPCGDQP